MTTNDLYIGKQYCLIQVIENPPFPFRKNSYTLFEIKQQSNGSYNVLYSQFTHSEGEKLGPFDGFIGVKEFHAGLESGKIKPLTDDLYAKILLENS